MSRIGNLPIEILAGVTIISSEKLVEITGPKGVLKVEVPEGIEVAQKESSILVSRKNEEKPIKAKHGLVRSLINNAIIGVTSGYEKKLEVNGVGFKIALQGKNLKLSLGFSHDIEFLTPEGIDVAVDGNIITISGIDKQKVGQVAAEIRKLKKPEPYKGKGIKYIDEQIIKKAGKSAATASA